jgi:hypothetical protein
LNYLWILQISTEAKVQERADGTVQAFDVPHKGSPFHAQVKCHLPNNERKLLFSNGVAVLDIQNMDLHEFSNPTK